MIKITEKHSESKTLEKKKVKKISKRWHSEDMKLCNRLQGLNMEYKHKLSNINCESMKVRKQAEDLITEQLRLADQDSAAEQKLRSELGLSRRQSRIRIDDALIAADRFGISASNVRRKSIQQIHTPLNKMVSSDSTNHKSGGSGNSCLVSSRRHSVHSSYVIEAKLRGPRKGGDSSSFSGSIQNDEEFIELPAVTTKIPTEVAKSIRKSPRRNRARSILELKRDSLGHRFELPPHRRYSVTQQIEKNDDSSRVYNEISQCRYLRLNKEEEEELSPEEFFSKK